eukprot:TRINITY_DN1760_c0_g1_i6.p1 TRINITY_DN1760_c0_g1~~TRINITY_DN1760_c0_g1_i6.p1  ORF type:complete len:257 (-),score=42.25 TRINITY_DN1760_c0_g1_i6:95-865(-)
MVRSVELRLTKLRKYMYVRRRTLNTFLLRVPEFKTSSKHSRVVSLGLGLLQIGQILIIAVWLTTISTAHATHAAHLLHHLGHVHALHAWHTATHAAHAAHAAHHLAEIHAASTELTRTRIIAILVLFILVHPLVEVSLDPRSLVLVLGQAVPPLALLLDEEELHLATSVVPLATLWVESLEQLELESGVASRKVELAGIEIDVDLLVLQVDLLDGEENLREFSWVGKMFARTCSSRWAQTHCGLLISFAGVPRTLR